MKVTHYLRQTYPGDEKSREIHAAPCGAFGHDRERFTKNKEVVTCKRCLTIVRSQESKP